MQTISRNFIGAAGAAALCLAMAVGASTPQDAAAALPKVKEAKFKVTVEGWQKDDWAANHESTGFCDPSDHSYGGEYAKFKSTKPVRLTAIQVGKNAPSFLIGTGQPYIDTSADVARNAVNAVSSVPKSCAVASGGGDGESLTPDCGLKSVASYPVALAYDSYFKDSITLTSAGAIEPLFYNCGHGTFPDLLERNEVAMPIMSELPYKELFDKKIGKLIVIGHGDYDLPLADYSEKTEVHWEVTFVRKGAGRH
jgi:hypothetical protein